jgi:hypothetical protein
MLTNELKLFAGNNTDFYVAFDEYYACKADTTRTPSISMAEMSEKIQDGFFKEVARLSGMNREDNPQAWMANPMVQWAVFAIVSEEINSLVPQYITKSLAPFVDFKTVGYGDVVNYEVKPRALYVVSRGGNGERTSFRQKSYKGNVVVAPIEHIVTVYTDLYAVLAGKEDLADFVRLVVLSIEREITADALAALNTGLTTANYPSQFIESGAWSAQTAIQLGQRLQAYNYGSKPVIMGTAAALSRVLPDQSAGYRMSVAGADGAVRIMKDFYGFELFELTQIPTGNNFGTMLDDKTLYFVSPAAGKVIKAVMSNALTNGNNHYDNADITGNFTMRRAWDCAFISEGYAGKYTITN